MHIDELYRLFQEFPSVETDTRKLKPGSLFFALKGPSFNGNHYAKQALEAGAAYCILDEAPEEKNDRYILVADSLAALQLLAKKHRQQLSIPFIAITGSNGKTTTKELVHEVLASTFQTSTTAGNLNNHIGIPLTILRIPLHAEIAVIEMGANHLGEIKSYCAYAMPTHGLITNCGKAHLEGFGSEEGVRKGKGELFDYLREHQGTAFIFNDYDYLVSMSKGIPSVITYGTQDARITGHISQEDVFLEVAIDKGADLPSIKTQLVGGYNLPNVLGAVAIGKHFDVADENIKQALEQYSPSNSRSQLMEKGGNSIVLDAYNANPSSMKAAIENFARMEGNNKVLILGGMMELGSESLAEHAAIVDLIRKYSWKAVALAGTDYRNLPDGILHFDSAEAVKQWYRKQDFQGVQVLVKGSRGMQMEKVLEDY